MRPTFSMLISHDGGAGTDPRVGGFRARREIRAAIAAPVRPHRDPALSLVVRSSLGPEPPPEERKDRRQHPDGQAEARGMPEASHEGADVLVDERGFSAELLEP